jgi:hypothetical protein
LEAPFADNGVLDAQLLVCRSAVCVQGLALGTVRVSTLDSAALGVAVTVVVTVVDVLVEYTFYL